MRNLKKGKGLKNRASKKRTHVFFCTFFDPHNLAKTGVWQTTVMTTRSGVTNYVEIRIRIVKSSSDDPKTTIFHFLYALAYRIQSAEYCSPGVVRLQVRFC